MIRVSLYKNCFSINLILHSALCFIIYQHKGGEITNDKTIFIREMQRKWFLYLSSSSFKWKASFKSKNVFVHEIGCKSGIEDIWLLGGNNHQMLQKCISKFINNHVILSHTYRKAISYLKISSQIFWHSNRNCNNLTSKNQYLLLSCIYGKYWYNSLFYLILKFDYKS